DMPPLMSSRCVRQSTRASRFLPYVAGKPNASLMAECKAAASVRRRASMRTIMAPPSTDLLEGRIMVIGVMSRAVRACDEAFGAAVDAGPQRIDVPLTVLYAAAFVVRLRQATLEVAEAATALVARHRLAVLVDVFENLERLFGYSLGDVLFNFGV